MGQYAGAGRGEVAARVFPVAMKASPRRLSVCSPPTCVYRYALEQSDFAVVVLTKSISGAKKMPIILWLLGVPVVAIIVLMLLGVVSF
ncbi:hypothetical protein [Hyphomicrobium sp. NDB2Meth4]|uniref:hypothetical protein n=1 Tax=Hyphomicrobium sp. NDB2Meth4 TaxID=1892846 RepID=UPI000A5DF0EF|nr:hypothetical protein [Hyphomicrobium sp. NDB2Meth4]